MWVMAVVAVAPCQCFSFGGIHTTSPGRIDSTGPPQRCTKPLPAVTIRVWPNGWVCHAVRAPGSNVTLAPTALAGFLAWNKGSTRTAPVKYSADPFVEGCEPLRLISILLSPQARRVDDEAIPHIAPLHTIVRIVDLVSVNDFDFGHDSVLPAVVKHLLRLGNPADVRARDTPVAVDERKRVELGTGRGQSDKHHGAEIPQESQLFVQVVRRADRVHDEAEPALKRLQGSGDLRGEEMLRTQARGVFLLVARRAEHRDIRTHRSRKLHRHVAQTAQTDDGDLVAWLAPELAKWRICRYASAHQRSSLSRVQHFRDTQHITLINNDVCRVA